MKACVATGFGEINKNVFVREEWPTPKDPPPPGHLIIKVLSCALAPGDVRVLSGKTDYIQLPDHGHPYIPGSDVSGIVVAVPESETKFQLHDYVISRFDEPKPQGGLAEYRMVPAKLSEKCPDSIPPHVSCGLSASAMAAKRTVTDFVTANDRVLIIGGSGGVGTSMIQYCKHMQAGYIVAVSTQTDLCKRLGAHQVIDYTKQSWWEMPEFQQNKFDVVLDLVNGDNWIVGGCSGKAVKPSGVYVALLSGVETEIEVHGIWDTVKLVFELLGRLLYTKLNRRVPKWVTPEALKLEDGDLKELLQDVVDGTLEPILDPSSPFDFSEPGVRNAFALQKSIHAHGKVVVNIASK